MNTNNPDTYMDSMLDEPDLGEIEDVELFGSSEDDFVWNDNDWSDLLGN